MELITRCAKHVFRAYMQGVEMMAASKTRKTVFLKTERQNSRVRKNLFLFETLTLLFLWLYLQVLTLCVIQLLELILSLLSRLLLANKIVQGRNLHSVKPVRPSSGLRRVGPGKRRLRWPMWAVAKPLAALGDIHAWQIILTDSGVEREVHKTTTDIFHRQSSITSRMSCLLEHHLAARLSNKSGGICHGLSYTNFSVTGKLNVIILENLKSTTLEFAVGN